MTETKTQPIKMITPAFHPILFPFVFLISILWATSATSRVNGDFLQCLTNQYQNATSKIVYTPSNPSYLPILDFSIQNTKFTSSDTPKPLVIITPLQESHVGRAIYCCQKYGIQVRTRSGGHDFEGLSFVSQVPFAIIDMFNLRSVDVDAKNETVWAQTGATLGEIYYGIANVSQTLGFPAGICPTVGSGGHVSGGGYGMLVRKYALAADHVIDARIVDVNGRILNRTSMGEDVFWAIRGGGGASFGVILAWKLKLVEVPETVTVFTVARTLEQNATQLVNRWQYVAPNTDENLVLRVYLQSSNTTQGTRANVAAFTALFLGKTDALLPLMQQNFSELGLKREDCTEMSWIESAVYFLQGSSLNYLLNRTYPFKANYKLKADLVEEPIPESAIQGIWQRFSQEDVGVPQLVLTPFGGQMNEIFPSKIPYPHRAGNIYLIEYEVRWLGGEQAALDRHLSWIRELYDYMAPYVSKNPRRAFLNYRDLDIGVNNVNGSTTVAEASKWGIRYFLNNFYRLVEAKTLIDPSNFFRHEQSIPPLTPQLIEEIGQHTDSKSSF